MTAITNQTPAAGPNPRANQTPANREAWRQEMLGQILDRMRERQPEAEAAQPTAPAIKAQGKGQYLDVYV